VDWKKQNIAVWQVFQKTLDHSRFYFVKLLKITGFMIIVRCSIEENIMTNWIYLGTIKKTSTSGYTTTVEDFYANFDNVSNFRAGHEGSVITFTSGDTYDVSQSPDQLINLLGGTAPA
jgi:hypothetical protein